MYMWCKLPLTLEGPGPVGVGAAECIRQRWLEAVDVHGVAADSPGLQQWDLGCCDQKPRVGCHRLRNAGVDLRHMAYVYHSTHSQLHVCVAAEQYQIARDHMHKGTCACHVMLYMMSASGCLMNTRVRQPEEIQASAAGAPAALILPCRLPQL